MNTLTPLLESVLKDFIDEMRRKLAKHPEFGDSWSFANKALLKQRFAEELAEAQEKYHNAEEWADVANFAMFLWYQERSGQRLYDALVERVRDR